MASSTSATVLGIGGAQHAGAVLGAEDIILDSDAAEVAR